MTLKKCTKRELISLVAKKRYMCLHRFNFSCFSFVSIYNWDSGPFSVLFSFKFQCYYIYSNSPEAFSLKYNST